MRSVVTAGVESEPSRGALASIELREGDVVHVAASDMTSAHAASELSEWAASLPPLRDSRRFRCLPQSRRFPLKRGR